MELVLAFVAGMTFGLLCVAAIIVGKAITMRD